MEPIDKAIRIVSIDWDKISLGVFCAAISICCYYIAAIVFFNLEWPIEGSLERTPKMFGVGMVIGSIFMIFATMLFYTSKRVYGYVGEGR